MYFIRLRGLQTKTSDNVERWHTVDERKTKQAAINCFNIWQCTHGYDHDLQLCDDKTELQFHTRTTIETNHLAVFGKQDTQ